jgi:hypothetical protein
MDNRYVGFFQESVIDSDTDSRFDTEQMIQSELMAVGRCWFRRGGTHIGDTESVLFFIDQGSELSVAFDDLWQELGH